VINSYCTGRNIFKEGRYHQLSSVQEQGAVC
jgi:hypothetical protein